MTWPLARGLARDLPGDFGDPLFTSWVLAWDVTHLGRGLWHANIFYPHLLALAYSEHFLPQALQILPIYAVTKNPILCYNLLFLSTFVLSGLGMFLLGRELTGSRTAGFVAGLAYAFAPYRVASLPHLQVLSAAWLPFVLFGFRRFFVTGRLRPLAGAALAWIAQNLSCGYYLLFFSPAVALYLIWEMTIRGAWGDRRTVLRTVAACAAVFIVTAPFLLPYLELRGLGFNPRSLGETEKFSADVYAYLSADPSLRIWGPIAHAWPKGEGLLFPGLTVVVLALCGAGAGLGRHREAEHVPASRMEAVYRVGVIACWLVVVMLLSGWSIRATGLRITSFSRALVIATVASALFLAVSRRTRTTVRRWLASPAGIFSVITLLAVVMSFGPDIHARGRLVAETSLYTAFFRYVPGFDGLRVPARFAMLVTFGLATLTAFGIAALERGSRRRACVVAGVASALILLEGLAVPIPINQNSTTYKLPGLAPLPASVAVGAGAPDVYQFIAQLPSPAVIVELPLGEPAFDIRYMFYSTIHWKPLVNGYSGGAPFEYGLLTEWLKDAAALPDGAWDALMASGATHAIVHEGFYSEDIGPHLSDWIRLRGGKEVAWLGADHVFLLH